jgi:hypothetical protein
MVAARGTTLRKLLEGTKQYQVPLCQRTYSWGPEQLKRRWDDVVKLAEERAEDEGATHFIGSGLQAGAEPGERPGRGLGVSGGGRPTAAEHAHHPALCHPRASGLEPDRTVHWREFEGSAEPRWWARVCT